MAELTADFELLGSGTSHGVPSIGCKCNVCQSEKPIDHRLRQSAFIRVSDGTNIMIDSGPETRCQLLRSKVTKIDHVLYTHPHADHIHGLDDLKVLARQNDLPLYMNAHTMPDIKLRYHYLFSEEGLNRNKHKLSLHLIDETPFDLGSVHVVPILLYHGSMTVYGYRFGSLAYCTDTNKIPDSSYELLKGVETLFIDALSPKTHPTHFTFLEALDVVERVQPKEAYFIHMNHSMSQADLDNYIQTEKEKRTNLKDIEVHPGYDGQIIKDVKLNKF